MSWTKSTAQRYRPVLPIILCSCLIRNHQSQQNINLQQHVPFHFILSLSAHIIAVMSLTCGRHLKVSEHTLKIKGQNRLRKSHWRRGGNRKEGTAPNQHQLSWLVPLLECFTNIPPFVIVVQTKENADPSALTTHPAWDSLWGETSGPSRSFCCFCRSDNAESTFSAHKGTKWINIRWIHSDRFRSRGLWGSVQSSVKALQVQDWASSSLEGVGAVMISPDPNRSWKTEQSFRVCPACSTAAVCYRTLS